MAHHNHTNGQSKEREEHHRDERKNKRPIQNNWSLSTNIAPVPPMVFFHSFNFSMKGSLALFQSIFFLFSSQRLDGLTLKSSPLNTGT